MSKRILIVDDDQDIRDIAQIAFEKFAKWETITAASGAEGLEKAKTIKLDAIVLDVSMPDLDGLEMFKKLQSDALTQKIPVVLLTAKVLASDRKRFAQMGVSGIIAKPFNSVTVWTELAKILGWDAR
jgi:CheY-like chemotaxis protein